jgi:hypothetical protein
MFCILRFPQAPITNASFTAMHTTVSTPFALIASTFTTKPGKWAAEQVGVKAPGNSKQDYFLAIEYFISGDVSRAFF